MKVSRSARVAGEYRKEISEIISGPLKNRCPDLSGLISVTKADVASDLANANIYISVYAKDEESAKATFAQIKAHAWFIRKELAHRMVMRTVPQLNILRDESLAYGAKIDRILEEIHKDETP